MQGNALPLRPIADGVARFLGWWRDELWGLVPEYGRRLMTGARSDVVLAEVDGRYLVLAETASRVPAAAPGPRVLPRAQAISQLVEAAQKAAPQPGSAYRPTDAMCAEWNFPRLRWPTHGEFSISTWSV